MSTDPIFSHPWTKELESYARNFLIIPDQKPSSIQVFLEHWNDIASSSTSTMKAFAKDHEIYAEVTGSDSLISVISRLAKARLQDLAKFGFELPQFHSSIVNQALPPPLHLCCLGKYIEFTGRSTCRSKIQDTPLHMLAIEKKGAWMSRWLQIWGADPNSQNIRGDTALHVAVRHNRHEQIEALLSNFTALSLCNHQGHTVLMDALRFGNNKTCALIIKKYLAKRDEFDRLFPSGESPLYFVARQGHLKLMQILLKAGATTTSGPQGSIGILQLIPKGLPRACTGFYPTPLAPEKFLPRFNVEPEVLLNLLLPRLQHLSRAALQQELDQCLVKTAFLAKLGPFRTIGELEPGSAALQSAEYTKAGNRDIFAYFSKVLLRFGADRRARNTYGYRAHDYWAACRWLRPEGIVALLA